MFSKPLYEVAVLSRARLPLWLVTSVRFITIGRASDRKRMAPNVNTGGVSAARLPVGQVSATPVSALYMARTLLSGPSPP